MIDVGKQYVEVSNSWLGIFKPEFFEFYVLSFDYFYFSDGKINPENVNPTFISFYFLEGSREDKVIRNVTTWLDVLSDIGGLLEIVAIVTTFCVASTQSFYFS